MIAFLALAHAGLPLVDMEIRVVVTGPIAEIQVTQTFRNDGPRPMDAVYVFPMHEDAAVDRMRMRIGDRVIEASIDEKAAAQRTYDAAVEAGQLAALTSQDTPDLFTQRVGNIPPGESVAVELAVVQTVERVDGVYELALPLARAPRFVPDDLPVDAWTAVQVPPDVLATVYVRGPTGAPVTEAWSPSHPDAAVLGEVDRLYGFVVSDLDHDFRLAWRTGGKEATASLLTDGRHVLVTVEPPSGRVPLELRTPRELVFLLDTSGSMEGAPWDRAVALLDAVLAGLRDPDSFQIVGVAGLPEALTAQPVPATHANRAEVRETLRFLHPEGPTDLYLGLQRALLLPPAEGRQRTVVVLTDGEVDVSHQALQVLESLRGDARVHAFALAPDPPRGVLAQLARLGGGVFESPRPDEPAVDTATRLAALLERPVVTDLSIDVPGVVFVGGPLPAVLPGRPVTRVGRGSGLIGGVP